MQNLQIALSGPVYIGYLTLLLLYLVRAVRHKRRAVLLISETSLG